MCKRVHHLLSDTEFKYCLLLDFCPQVIDIKEQFALLPYGETSVIATELKLRHPRFDKSVTPFVMSTDLVVTTLDRRTGLESVCAHNVKKVSNLTHTQLKRDIKKHVNRMTIEHAY